MSAFFGFLAFAAIVCLIIGLIKPGIMVFWSKKKSRGMSSLIYGLAFIVFVIIASVTGSPKATTTPTSASAVSSQASTVSKSTSSKAAASSEAPKTINVNQALTDGYYTVGTDLPAGTYNLTAAGGSGNVITSDGEINEIMGDSGDKTFNNAKLVAGQVLSVSGVKLQITSSNASGAALKPRNQTGLPTKQLAAGNYTAGTDFPAGTYDLAAIDGQGNVMCDNGTIPLNAIMGTDSGDGMTTNTYKNVAFKAGNVLKITGATISITPSK